MSSRRESDCCIKLCRFDALGRCWTLEPMTAPWRTEPVVKGQWLTITTPGNMYVVLCSAMEPCMDAIMFTVPMCRYVYVYTYAMRYRYSIDLDMDMDIVLVNHPIHHRLRGPMHHVHVLSAESSMIF